MGHTRKKTTYSEGSSLSSHEEKTVYADFNNSNDHVTFFTIGENGTKNIHLTIDENLTNNLLDAIIRLYETNIRQEDWTKEEIEMFKYN